MSVALNYNSPISQVRYDCYLEYDTIAKIWPNQILIHAYRGTKLFSMDSCSKYDPHRPHRASKMAWNFVSKLSTYLHSASQGFGNAVSHVKSVLPVT